MRTDSYHLVFLVEDDKFMRELIKRKIESKSNAIVMAFPSAEEALCRMHLHPDLIMLDFFLDSDNPENMNGHEAVTAFRKVDPEVPVLFVSAEGNENMLVDYQQYRSIPHITKSPFNLAHLHETIPQFWRQSA